MLPNGSELRRIPVIVRSQGDADMSFGDWFEALNWVKAIRMKRGEIVRASDGVLLQRIGVALRSREDDCETRTVRRR